MKSPVRFVPLSWRGAWLAALPLILSAGFAGAAQVSHVIQMSLDGLGAKYLQFYVTNAPAQFPNFRRLMAEGAFTFNARCDVDLSETIPNHASIFTGRPVLQPAGASNTVHHGYNVNFPPAGDTFHISGNANVPYKSSFFDVAHDFGLTTALYAGKTRIGICDRSYDGTNGALDFINTDNGRDKIDFASVPAADISGTSISNGVTPLIQDLALTNALPKRYSFIHIAEPDLTGHSANWGTPAWSNAVRNVDAQVGRILNAIDAHPALSNRTALIVSADHGGGGVSRNGHTEAYHITNYTIPFFLRAPGIPAGADLYPLFANRGNPGTNRTDYNTQPQPIRNGDGGNLALGLLGLPPIPGSFMVPALVFPEPSLTTARFMGQVTVFWADPVGEYQLEATETHSSPSDWQPITDGIATNDTTRVFAVTNATELSARFFRLRRLPPP